MQKIKSLEIMKRGDIMELTNEERKWLILLIQTSIIKSNKNQKWKKRLIGKLEANPDLSGELNPLMDYEEIDDGSIPF